MNIVIAAGGTGGHLYPAVALAREFIRQEPASAVLFVGTERGIESKVLPREGFELAKITAKPVMGRGLSRAAGAVLALPRGLWQSIGILRARRAQLVIGIGGYSSPPVLVAAFLLGIPRVILEPNAYPGLANKVLGPIAQIVFLAFDAAAPYFKQAKVRVVGTPIRRDFLDAGPAEAGGSRPVHAEDTQTVLIFGGSQGAHAINQAMVEALPHLQARRERLAVIHQTGEADHAWVQGAYRTAGFEARAEIVPFLFDMPRALRSADLVVSRSGAVSLAELTACGKAAILIPLPHAIYQHQERNARVLERAGAAVVLLQQDLAGPKLAQTIEALLGDADRLRRMGERSRALGRTDSAESIVRDCRTLVGGAYDVNKPDRGAASA
ncbi:MAG: undecaprenyldiphospho-muramoylpentapeptide beta-N-acetylglucosaminyltransferase [Nitrospirae bacterium]|nr:MAG: undecaprenyldiphospho-muramoylpentapeptide beta-N-acetylglucosaminyltransferase [Nitrospirota bacterium]